MEKRQVIVIGAGPSGSITSFYLAKSGVDVLMLDKAEFPQDKPCGDVQILTNFPIFKEMGIMEEIDNVGNKDYGLILFDHKYNKLTLQSKKPLSYNTERKKIDAITCKAAVNAGAELRENFDVRELIVEHGVVKGVKGFRNGSFEEIRADLTVIACGSHPMVARQLGIFKEDPDLIHYSARGYYNNVQGLPEDATETYYLEDFSPNGYIWLSALGNGRANVGVFLSEKALQKSGRKLEDWIPWWIENSEMGKKRLSNAELDGEIKGWRIAASKKIEKNYAAGCLIVGDSGNMVESFQGEGYPQATMSAYIAGHFIPQVLEKGDFSEEALAPYFAATQDKINLNMYLMAGLRATLFRKPDYLTVALKGIDKIPNRDAVLEKATDVIFKVLSTSAENLDLDWEKYRKKAANRKKLDAWKETAKAYLPKDLPLAPNELKSFRDLKKLIKA